MKWRDRTVVCRIIGHDFRDPWGNKIDSYVPSAEIGGKSNINCRRCGLNFSDRR